MKRLLIIPILLLFLSQIAWLNMGPTQPLTLTCTLYDSYTATENEDEELALARYSTGEYGGTTWNDAAAGGTICRVDFYIQDEPADPSVNDYYLEIYLMDGNNLNKGALQGRSDKVDGVNPWGQTWVTFTFSTPVAYSQSTAYGFAWKAIDSGDPADTLAENDGTNYIRLGFDENNDSTAKLGGLNTWNDDGTSVTLDADDDPFMKVYTMQ